MPPKKKTNESASSSSAPSRGGKKSPERDLIDFNAIDDENDTEDDDAGDQEDDDLLPDEISPTHYALFIQPNYSTWTFDGRVVVTLRIDEEADQIQFNAADLQIDSAELATNNAGVLIPTRILNDEEEEVTTLRFEQPLAVGEAILTIVYRGILSEKLNGLYKTQYHYQNVQQTILVTQFEACDARRCLPCWDEPARKATFSLTLTIPSNLTALSNMPVLSSHPSTSTKQEGSWTDVTFQPTPVMSSYLLAMAIGQFESIQTTTKNGIIIRLLTPLGKIDQGAFSLELGKRCVEFYEDYFQLPYPLPKLDLIAVPDIAIVAMENWGLITFGESALLVHPTESSHAGKQYVALLVAHEIAHQWFGNICTMSWWTDLWLNEGFASWMEYFCVDALFPDWDMWSQYLTVHYTYSFSQDSLSHTHPVEVEVDDPTEIDEVFDGITYSKGSVVVRMLHAYLGDEEFRRGVSAYLKHYSYANAETKDLWAKCSEISGKDVKKMMEQWSLQPGFPVVTVKNLKFDKASNKLSFEATQRKFQLGGPLEKDATKWTLPITLRQAGKGQAVIQHPELFTELNGKYEFTLPNAEDASSSSSSSSANAGLPAFKLNPNQVYLYRVLYPLPYYAVLKNSLFDFCPNDRLGLLNDLYAFQRANLVPFSLFAEFLELLSLHENDVTVWLDVCNNLQEFASLYRHSSELPKLNQWLCTILERVFERVGWDAKAEGQEHHTTGLLRGKLVAMLTGFGHVPSIEEACARFHQFIAKEQLPTPAADTVAGQAQATQPLLHADLREAIYSCVVAYGGMLGFSILKSRFVSLSTQSGTNREEIVRVLNALGSSTDRGVLTKLLEESLDDDRIRTEDAAGLIVAIAYNSTQGCSQLLWDFMKRRWKAIVSEFEGAFSLPRIVGLLGLVMTSDANAAEVQAFFKKNEAPTAERAVKQSIERIQSNAKWMNREEKNIKTWVNTRLAQIKVANASK